MTNHFLNKFRKFQNLEIEWVNREKNADKEGIFDMNKYKDKLARKEKELLADMRLMGEEGIEAMKNRVR